MTQPITAPLTYLTADVPGTGGVIRERQEDFLVEEQPLYQPTGQGEHLFLYIEKRGLTTSDVVRRLARQFAVSRNDIGYAGMKDKHAVTRQHLSVRLPDPSRDAEVLARVEQPRLKVLWSARHLNKLRKGHLAGNRFIIYIRQVNPAAVVHAKQALDRLAAQGVPNFLGEQRFGYRQVNHRLGWLLLRGRWEEFLSMLLGQPMEVDGPTMRAAREAYERRDYVDALANWPKFLRHERQALDALRQGRSAQEAVRAIDLQQREYLITALQSAMFNRVLDARIRAGLLHKLIEGDLAWKHDNGAVFAVDAATAEKENSPEGRVPKLEVSPSGPMWGRTMPRPTGLPGTWELDVLGELEVTEADLQSPGMTVDGARRPMRAPLRDPGISAGADAHGPFIRVAFELPRGSFATIVLREIMKPELTGASLPDED